MGKYLYCLQIVQLSVGTLNQVFSFFWDMPKQQ